MVNEFDPGQDDHVKVLERLAEDKKEELDIDYTPENSYWVLENHDRDQKIYTSSYIKAMWWEEILSQGMIDGSVAIISWDTK